MTILAAIRQRAGLWFSAGVLVTVAVVQLGPTSAAIGRPLLVESSCAGVLDLTLSGAGSRSDRVSLPGPGTYRLGTDDAPELVIAAGERRRSVRELPLTAGGALALPIEWCSGNTGATTGAGLGL